MRLYLKIIFITLTIILGLAYSFAMPAFYLSFWDCIKIILECFVWAAVINLGIMFILSRLPKNFFNENHFIFRTLKWEKRFYEIIRIKKWKDKIPECGKLGNFKKDKIYDISNNLYVKKFLSETCFAGALHVLCGLGGFIIIFILPSKYFWVFTLPFALVHFILHMLPSMVQRYNRPKLIMLYKWNLAKEEKQDLKI